MQVVFVAGCGCILVGGGGALTFPLPLYMRDNFLLS